MKVTQNLITGVAADEASSANLTADAKQFVFTVHTTAPTTATFKFVAGFKKDVPDFLTASSNENDWHYVQVIDTEDGTTINGDTGVTLSAAALHKAYSLNLDGAEYIGVIISGATGGGLEIDVMLEDSLAR